MYLKELKAIKIFLRQKEVMIGDSQEALVFAGAVAHNCLQTAWEVETHRLRVQSWPQLFSEFEAGLYYMGSCFKQNKSSSNSSSYLKHPFASLDTKEKNPMAQLQTALFSSVL